MLASVNLCQQDGEKPLDYEFVQYKRIDGHDTKLLKVALADEACCTNKIRKPTDNVPNVLSKFKTFNSSQSALLLQMRNQYGLA